MTDNTQQNGEQNQQEESVVREFRELGKNIIETFRAAWESSERRRLQQEIESGLNEFGTVIRQEINHISSSPTGQRIKSDVQGVAQRIQTGELETKARDEILSALRMINTELQKVATKMAEERGGQGGRPDEGETPSTAGPASGAHTTGPQPGTGQGGSGSSGEQSSGGGQASSGSGGWGGASSEPGASNPSQGGGPADAPATPSGGHQEVHPDDVASSPSASPQGGDPKNDPNRHLEVHPDDVEADPGTVKSD